MIYGSIRNISNRRTGKVNESFLEASEISFVKDDEARLPQHVLDGIARGQADIEAGRFTTYEEFKKKYLHRINTFAFAGSYGENLRDEKKSLNL